MKLGIARRKSNITYTDGLDQERFVASGLNYDATARNLGLIGEAQPADPWLSRHRQRHLVEHRRIGRASLARPPALPQKHFGVRRHVTRIELYSLHCTKKLLDRIKQTLAARFCDELAAALTGHGASQEFIERELAVTIEAAFAKTTNRSVLGGW
jgi:hypothetical protein